jgi:hypothetical protein
VLSLDKLELPSRLRIALFASLLGACDPSGVIGFDRIAVGEPDARVEDPELDAGESSMDASELLDAEPMDSAAADREVADTAVVDAAPRDAASLPKQALSGLLWASGVHYGNESPTYRKFAEFRGRPLDIAALYTDRNSWAGLVAPDWQISVFEGYPVRWVLSQPLYPLQPAGLNNKDCAAGAYDSEWKKLGTFLNDKGRGDAILRLGWGANDPKHDWHADADPSDFINCFRHIVRAVRSSNPRVLFDFSFDPVPASIPQSGNPYDLYPGDDYVDIVGMDLYDRLPLVRTDAEWKAKCEAPLGLCTLIKFAREHKKRFAVGEWGVTTCSPNAAGDNPFFVEKMVQTFHDNADVMAYEAYFDDPAAEVCSSIFDGGLAPNASAAYRRVYQMQ